MPPHSTVQSSVESAVVETLQPLDRVVLAVSGGVDSMVLMHAAALLDRCEVSVATFDHGTGSVASKAAGHVARTAGRLGLPVVLGRAARRGRRESEWRAERWRFLRDVGQTLRAPIVTAHTRDDQLETVFMRILRHAGARGLAGLYAPSDVIRPLLHVPRATIEAYAQQHDIAYVEDPTNESRLHLRNRVRHDLIPSILQLRPGFDRELLDLARRAATWREGMETLAQGVHHEVTTAGELRVMRAGLAGFDVRSLRVLWPALAAKAGLAMDWRGTHRLAEFTITGAEGKVIQLSGGFEVVMAGDHVLLRRWRT